MRGIEKLFFLSSGGEGYFLDLVWIRHRGTWQLWYEGQFVGVSLSSSGILILETMAWDWRAWSSSSANRSRRIRWR